MQTTLPLYPYELKSSLGLFPSSHDFLTVSGWGWSAKVRQIGMILFERLYGSSTLLWSQPDWMTLAHVGACEGSVPTLPRGALSFASEAVSVISLFPWLILTGALLGVAQLAKECWRGMKEASTPG